MVADHYARDPEGLAGQPETSHKRQDYDLAFLATVVVPPGVPFTEKPLADIIRADFKQALAEKVTPTVRSTRSARFSGTRT